jgi:hypothetical protein
MNEDYIAQSLRDLERINPKRARKLMLENPRLLNIRKNAAKKLLQGGTNALQGPQGRF